MYMCRLLFYYYKYCRDHYRYLGYNKFFGFLLIAILASCYSTHNSQNLVRLSNYNIRFNGKLSKFSSNKFSLTYILSYYYYYIC